MHLLDANVLIALVNRSHLHHAPARDWFAATDRRFATCPITQGSLLRHYFRDVEDASPAGAHQLIESIGTMPGHEFWADRISYASVDLNRILGHRQVTDAYLVALVQQHNAKLATLDRGLHLLHPQHSVLLPPD